MLKRKLISLILSLCFLLSVSSVYSATPLHQVEDPQRSTLLASVVRSSGYSCGASNYSFYAGTYKRIEYWDVACTNMESFRIGIEEWGEMNTKILSCSFMKRNGMDLKCFKKFQ